MVLNNVLEAIGNTPLIRLNRLTDPDDAVVLVKFEGVNIGGSIKTRSAHNMISEARRRGELQPDSIIVEPTSGNQGIGLALVGAVFGYKVRLVMPDSVSEERKKILEAYGAEVVQIHDDGDIGACIEECLQTANKFAREDSRVYVPQQFVNPANTDIHRSGTAREIIDDVGGPVDGFCCGIGTGGTLTGVGEVLRDENPDILIWAVEPENAAILSGKTVTTHLQMGIGDGLIPDNLNTRIYSDIAIVSDEEALRCAQALARQEGILCGITSGSNVAAALRMAKVLGRGKTVVTILPDTGERYFSTPLYKN